MPLRLPIKPMVLAITALAAMTGRGDITYTLQFSPGSSAQAQQVANSVAVAAAFYNQHGSFNKHWNVYYNTGIPTAEANYDGYMGFGGTRNERVVFHEAGHTFGMGTGPNYSALIAGGVWKGQYGNQAQFDTYNDYGDGLHGDGHAVWPSGFNYDNEDGTIERYWHTRIMAGIRADMGILSFTREAQNDAVTAGGTAEFRVESPRAATFRWSKNSVALTNGGDISGADRAVLRITNVEAADAGAYRCTVTGAAETLASRPRQLWVHAAPQLGQWNFNGNATDSVNANHGTAFGTPAYVAGKIGQAVDLDGTDDYIDLPDAVGRVRDLTVAAWLNWDGGNNWQRLFDFGTGTFQYLFLSPKSGSNTMRLAFKDSIHGKDVEYQVNAPVPVTGQWVHLAAVMRAGTMTLYVNGLAAGSAYDVPGSLAGFPATSNYIGKSQFADPLLNGRVDDLRIHARALSGAEIWALWGQNPNQAPVFSQDLITLPAVNALQPFAGPSLAPFASDPEGNPLTFAKLNGPAWLTVAANGTLSGQPGPDHDGTNTFVVRVTDASGAGSDATLQIPVDAPLAAPVTASLTAPASDGDDPFFFPGSVAESGTIGGTTAAGDNDESTYAAENRSSKGQSFTTGPNPSGYLFQSFSVQHVNWPALTSPGTTYDLQPGDRWEFQIGALNGTAKSPVLKYTAIYDGAALTGSGNSGTGRFLTFNISGLGIQLEPDTTYYFEIAPLSGDPVFELNSSRTGTYAGGTAFRGNTAGTISTAVNSLEGDFAFHVNLEARAETSSSTVAYWNFEEGTANTYVPYARTSANQYEGSIPDRSGHANHLSVWNNNWHWYRAQVPPGATTPGTGAANTLSLQNAGSYPGVTAIGTSLTSWSPVAWTIEAMIRPDDATNGYQTFIGRDSQGANAGDPALAVLYFQITPTGALQIAFTDAAGNAWSVASAANAIQDAKWHAVAAVSTGTTLSLYRKNLTNGDANYTLLGTVNLSSSVNPALSTGTGNGGDWDPGVFSFARGLFNGGHTDRFFGYLDDIRFSGGALAPAQFLATAAAPLTAEQTWRQTHFATTSNTGTAADGADPDQDGIPNLLERALGGNPKAPDSGEILPAPDPAEPLLTIRYAKAKGFPGLTLTVQESSDGSPGSWTPATGTETLTDLGAVVNVKFTTSPSPTGRKFLRLQAVQGP